MITPSPGTKTVPAFSVVPSVSVAGVRVRVGAGTGGRLPPRARVSSEGAACECRSGFPSCCTVGGIVSTTWGWEGGEHLWRVCCPERHPPLFQRPELRRSQSVAISPCFMKCYHPLMVAA